MARIIMKLKGMKNYSSDIVSETGSQAETTDITLATDKVAYKIVIPTKVNGVEGKEACDLSIQSLSFHKQMYQPTEITVELSIALATSKSTDEVGIGRQTLVNLFENLKVSLEEGSFSIGDDFYVHEVVPYYKKDSIRVVLKIYSLDKLLTLQKASRTFVAKRLASDILNTEIPKYAYPWDVKKTEEQRGLLTYDASNMQILKYDGSWEHIFPYLVQYNESFYDFLCRTANRWGEFLYYENGALNIGYKKNMEEQEVTNDKGEKEKKKVLVAEKVSIDNVQEITFCDLNGGKAVMTTGSVYNCEASNDQVDAKAIEESPFFVKAQLGAFGGKADKWIMKQLANVFKNDTDLPTMVGDMLFDNLFGLAQASSEVAKYNADFNEKYLKDHDSSKQQYSTSGDKKTFQQFTEKDTKFTYAYYKSILAKELAASSTAICINYGTTNPELKLGDIIAYGGENFIVIDISSGYEDGNLVFHVIASSQIKDGLFYPAVIPAGHVRYAHPQPATVTDADDPGSLNRVRVMFSWQDIQYKDDEKTKVADASKNDSTPWLKFASNQQGMPMNGRHYEGNPVMVGFEDGNVERPYVMGGLTKDACLPLDHTILTTPGRHQMTLTDGAGDGIAAFLAGAFSPVLKNVMSFYPGLIPEINWDKNKYFEGGFSLNDYYGIYKISGSTDGRNVSISSTWGDVKIDAFTGITISAPNGDVKIKGKNVSIEAGNNLSLVSGKNVVNKLWKTKDTKKGTAAQMLLDVTAEVTKRLAQTLMNVVDLSLVRSVVEVFFRPVEGTLTVKSNRYLKLEAGNNTCAFPASAFNREEKIKMLNEMNKKAIMQSAGIGNGMVKTFETLKTVTDWQIDRFNEKYTICQQQLSTLKDEIAALKCFAEYDNNEAAVCKAYDNLKGELWSQENDTDWTEEKLGFTDKVQTDNADNVNNQTAQLIYGGMRLPQAQMANEKKNIINKRKKHKENVLEACNALRHSIYELTHPVVKKKDIDKAFGSFNKTIMPKDFKNKIITALSPDKCAAIYGSDKFKNFQSLGGEFIFTENQKTTLRRLAAINLLEEFGFKDNTRTGGVAKPTAENVCDIIVWGQYVGSLSGLPPIGKDLSTVGGALANAVTSSFDAQVDKLKFWQGALERKTWGEGQNGQILFASGATDTYALRDANFEMVETLKPNVISLREDSNSLTDREKNSISGFMEKLRKVLLEY